MFWSLSNWEDCEKNEFWADGPLVIFVPFASVVFTLFSFCSVAAADLEPAVSPRQIKALTQTFRGTLSQKPLRDACQTIAATSGANLWFDPMTNPSRTIDLQQSGGTVWDALVEVAAEGDVVAAIAPTFVLVADADRIDGLFAAAHSSVGKPVDADWPRLTKPIDALIRLGHIDTDANDSSIVPHDLLPAYEFRSVDPRSLSSVVISTYQSEPMPSTLQPLFYPSAVLRRLQQRGIEIPRMTRSTFADRSTTDVVSVTANWQQHRRFTAEWVETEPVQKSAAAAEDARFSLKVRARAVDVMAQLAAAANRRVEWPADLADIKEQIITLDRRDATLRQLIRDVAEQIHLNVQWDETTLRMQKP